MRHLWVSSERTDQENKNIVSVTAQFMCWINLKLFICNLVTSGCKSMKSLVSFLTEGAYEPCGAFALASVPKLQFRQEQEEEVEEVYCEVNTNKTPVPVSHSLQFLISKGCTRSKGSGMFFLITF